MPKIVACSDTHGKHNDLKIPEGDIFIFAGDFEIRNYKDLLEIRNWLFEQPHKYVVTIFGNHDFTDHFTTKSLKEFFGKKINYLYNEAVDIMGLRIWGSSYSPYFNNWAWMKFDSDLKEIWNSIPIGTDIVVTHTMPHGILDQVLPRMQSVGSYSLKDAIKRVKPKIQIGGHLHESFGQYTDGKTDYYNVSVLDEMYQIANPITIIEV